MAFIRSLKKRFPIGKPLAPYSQNADVICESFFENLKIDGGVYVAISKHYCHPSFGNSSMSPKGWQKVIIERIPSPVNIFDLLSKKDITLKLQTGAKSHANFSQAYLNGIVKNIKEKRVLAQPQNTIIKIINVRKTPLEKILDDNLFAGQTILLLSIDMEGFDIGVLKTNNWTKHIPLFVIVKSGLNINSMPISDVCKFLRIQDYEPLAKNGQTSIFKYNGY